MTCWNEERVAEYPDEPIEWARGMWYCPCVKCQNWPGLEAQIYTVAASW